jgi:hypothetical protein
MIRKCEKENLLLVLPMAYRDALRDKETVYIMLNYRDKAKVRITWGKAPQAGYLILGVVNYTSCVDKATVFLYWPMIDSSYPVSTDYIQQLLKTVACEVW